MSAIRFRPSLLSVIAVSLSVIIGVVSATLYHETIESRNDRYDVESSIVLQLGMSLAEAEVGMEISINDSLHITDRYNSSNQAVAGLETSYWSASALLVMYDVNREEHRIFQDLEDSLILAKSQYTKCVQEPLWANYTQGTMLSLSEEVLGSFVNVTHDLDALRLQSSIFLPTDHPYSKVALMDLQVVQGAAWDILRNMQDLETAQ